MSQQEEEENSSAKKEEGTSAKEDKNDIVEARDQENTKTSTNHNPDRKQNTTPTTDHGKEEQRSQSNSTERTQSPDQKLREQMMAELERLRREMLSTAATISRPRTMPYSPDIFNDLSPYYNKFLVDYMIRDQEPYYDSWKSYGQRATSLNIIDPETSWRMDHFPAPHTVSRIPGHLFHPKNWSKNLSGLNSDMGSTHLTPVPRLRVKKMPHDEYQHFTMTYDQVPYFRRDMKAMYESIANERAKIDYKRIQRDWKRMNLSELNDLPSQTKTHMKKVIGTYLGTSKGSLKALHGLSKQLDSPEPTPIDG